LTYRYLRDTQERAVGSPNRGAGSSEPAEVRAVPDYRHKEQEAEGASLQSGFSRSNGRIDKMKMHPPRNVEPTPTSNPSTSLLLQPRQHGVPFVGAPLVYPEPPKGCARQRKSRPPASQESPRSIPRSLPASSVKSAAARILIDHNQKLEFHLTSTKQTTGTVSNRPYREIPFRTIAATVLISAHHDDDLRPLRYRKAARRMNFAFCLPVSPLLTSPEGKRLAGFRRAEIFARTIWERKQLR